MKGKLTLVFLTVFALAHIDQAIAGYPTFYGKINVSLNKYSLEKVNFIERSPATTPASFANTGATSIADELDQWALESNASRIGFKGDYDVSSELKALYVLEWGTDVDNGSSGGQTFSQRNIWGGLQGNWGTLAAGKIDTPLKTVQTNAILQSDIDRFNDMPLADLGSYLVGENRENNIILYTSPLLLGGLEVKLAAIQNEETGVENSTTDPQDDNDLGAGKSISFSYGKANWYLGLAADENVQFTDAVRIVGEAVTGPIRFGALYQRSEQHEKFDKISPFSTFVGSSVSNRGPQNGLNPLSEWDGVSGSSFKEQDGYVLNAAWKVAGPWTLKLQYGHSEATPLDTAFDDVEIDSIAFGGDFKLNDNAKLYSYYATLEAEGDPLISTESTEDKVAAIGFDLKF